MAQEIGDLGPSTSTSTPSLDQSEVTSNFVRLPKVVLERIDEQKLLNLKTSASAKSSKRVTKISDKVQQVLNKSPKKPNDLIIKRPRGRPKKTSDEAALSIFKKNNLKLGVKNKTVTSSKTSPMLKKNKPIGGFKQKTVSSNNSTEELESKSGKLLKKTMLQNKSKVLIPQSKTGKVPPTKGIKQILSEAKQNPPKPKLEVMQSTPGENSSDTSGDEFLYDELIEELESTAHKRIVNTKPVPEKTTITLKPNDGNKPPTVLKGGIVKRTDLPSDLNLFAPSTKSSNVVSNGLQKTNQTAEQTLVGKRKIDSLGKSAPAKKSSPWPVSFVGTPKKSSATSLNNNKKKTMTTKVGISQLSVKPTTVISPKTTYSPFVSPEVLPESNVNTLGIPKAKIGPKQTAKVVPLYKSFDAEDSDEYLEEETLECDLEVDKIPKESLITSDVSPTGKYKGQDANNDLLKILTDDSEEPIKTKSNEKSVVTKLDATESRREEKIIKQLPTDAHLSTNEQTKVMNEEEAPVRTIYDVMNELFLDNPSWNLHLIPETNAFCIAQVTKGRLGLPTLKKCIELDPVNYSAKVYIHQYHIKRFDGVYDGEESILALIREIDSIKA